MMNGVVFPRTFPNHLLYPTTKAFPQHSYSCIQPQDHHRFASVSVSHGIMTSMTKLKVTSSDSEGSTSDSIDTDWGSLGFNPVETDYMYVMKSSEGGKFSGGDLQRFGAIKLNPSSCILNYGQGIIEGLKAYRKEDSSIVIFRPGENGLRMKVGADRMCMPAPSVEQFVEAVNVTVLANRRWVIPADKGFLYIRPLLMGTGSVLSLMPAPEYTFLVYVTPVQNYFKGGLESINLVVENEIHHATPGGVGFVKAIGNYAPILKAQSEAKAKGFSDVLYLDAVNKRYLEEASTANIFVVKDRVIYIPELRGTILPGITRKSIIELALSLGFQVEERLVITCHNKRVSYRNNGLGSVTQQLYSALVGIQMGLAEDKMGWCVTLK
ncbi:Branched-chain-amino-acid aminotransferase [Quillaja saponaria]|uniref:Branched-chain-amino-acid aminotransferase n=1 Tax=Quillaja saponaria TaxID=32244 RepID=A0AAD7LI11_QUISA|nr:Branched-chain-amino-acid aminotransferase [Quillaja saponaria]